jgi:hypothetical protein
VPDDVGRQFAHHESEVLDKMHEIVLYEKILHEAASGGDASREWRKCDAIRPRA